MISSSPTLAPVVEIDLETQIDQQALLLHTAPTQEGRRAAMKRLTELNAMRSPERVEQMERERGLRR